MSVTGHWRETFATFSLLAWTLVGLWALAMGAGWLAVHVGGWDWSFVPVTA